MKYHDITKDDMLNGDGLRVVLWVSGCEHACRGCHNPVTWDPDDGLEFNEDGKREIFEQLDKEYISGITLTGGDPLFPGNRIAVTELVTEIKEKYPDKTIWIYTGYQWEEIKDLSLTNMVDVVVDGKFIVEQQDNTLYWKGSANQRVIDVSKTMKCGEIILLEE